MKKSILILALFVLAMDSAMAQPPEVSFKYKYPYPDGIPMEKYRERRDKVLATMSERSFALVFSGDYYTVSTGEFDQPRQNPNFYYLTGSAEMGNILLLCPGGVDVDGTRYKEILFVRNTDLRSQFWIGPKMNVGDAGFLRIDRVESMENFKPVMERLFSYKDTLFLEPVGSPAAGTPATGDSLPDLRKYGMAANEVRDYIYKFRTVVSPFDNELKKLREVKDKDELRLMQTADDITIKAFENTIKSIKAGMPEYAVQAEMEFWFRKQGAEKLAFPSITGSGANTCIIHYMANRDTVHAGDLVLMDCGSEYHGYASDVTRTVPADGKFTAEQKIIYDIVLEAHDSAVAQCRAGRAFMATQLKAMDIISKRLVEIGVIKEVKDNRNYFPHGVSHYVGLDVHDVGTYSVLKPGNVVTIEPGIYIPEGSPCDRKWWNIGVRIEDDVLVTDSVPVVMTGKLATRPEEIEKLMERK